MAKVTIHIPQVAWRDGRPRYQPGPKARKLGMKGQDLKNSDGTWMSAEQARDWVERELQPRLAEVRAAKAAGKRAPQRRAPNAFTVEDLFEALWQSPKYREGKGTSGPNRRVLSPVTIADYRSKASSLQQFDPELFGCDVKALTKPILIGLHERLWAAKGLRTANAIITVLRLALSYATTKELGGLQLNVALRMGLESTPPRIRVGSFLEMRTLLAAADAIGATMIGHGTMLGLMTGQRQTDRLALQDAGNDKGWRRFRQSKTGALVEVPETPQLAARLEAAAAERQARGVKVANVLVDLETGLGFTPRQYGKRFRRVRKAAVAGVRGPDGAWRVEPCPSLADFHDQDLRDTAVTWLARAGCSIPEIRAITGHDADTIYKILKHYLAIDREQAGAAIGKLVTWMEREGAAL